MKIETNDFNILFLKYIGAFPCYLIYRVFTKKLSLSDFIKGEYQIDSAVAGFIITIIFLILTVRHA